MMPPGSALNAARTTRLRTVAWPRRARHGALPLRVQVWWRTIELDRALASGQPPCSPQLELRVQQLASVRVRWGLAHSVRMLVAQAEQPLDALGFGGFSAARAVLIAREALLELADALTDPGCTSVRGVARASCLVCDSANSPLYGRTLAGALRRVAYEALAMLRAST
jgi:hypothetical protein